MARSVKLLIVAVSVVVAAASSHAIEADKVELKLAVALADDTPAYKDSSAQDKVFLYAGDTAVVHFCETGGTATDWYCVDNSLSYGYYDYEYILLKPGPKLEIRPLEGAVAVNKANVREYPSTDARVVTTLSGGSVVTVLARATKLEQLEGFKTFYYWYEVRTSEGEMGWIYGALLGILQPGKAYEFAVAAFRQNEPDDAIRVLGPAYERFPNSNFYQWRSSTFKETYFEFGPSCNLLAGYAYYLKGDMETARSYCDAALACGDKPARTALRVVDADAGVWWYEYCEDEAATLARVGLGLTYARSDPEKAAEYFARAIADSESGISTENTRPEYFDAFLVRNLIATYGVGEVTDECMQAVGALLPPKCSHDFAPAYFLLNYGEALERGGNGDEAVVLYERIVNDCPPRPATS